MKKALIGLQIDGTSFIDEGIEPVLDVLQNKAAVNTLVLTVQALSARGVMGRHITNHHFPDHGSSEPDDIWGGAYFNPHPQYYGGTFLPAFRAPDKLFEGIDVLEMTLPAAHARGMQVYAWLYENPYRGGPRLIPNMPKVGEIDVFGRKTHMPCFNNPDYRNWLFSITEDLVKSYPIDGLQYGSERRGSLGDFLMGSQSQQRVPACFCEHCLAKGRVKGINAERAREGSREVYDFVTKARAGERPVDGYLVTFLRILLRYPEVLAWEYLWHEGAEAVRKEIYGTVKAIKPEVPVGWHVWHSNSFSAMFRAENDFSEMKHYSDYIKPVIYHNVAGPRFHRNIGMLSKTVFGDVPPELLSDLYQKFLGYDEPAWAELPKTGFSGKYVRSETERCVKGVNNEIPVYPGIDVDIPTEANETKMEPEDVKEGIRAAFAGGASGIIVSRKYSEMWLKNVAAVSEVLRELGYA